MYLSLYKLLEKPFNISTDPRFLWYGEKHEEALANLKYGLLEPNGYVVLTGEVGTGKTTLVNALIETLDDNIIVANINNPSLDTIEFFKQVAKTYYASVEITTKNDFLFFFTSFLQKSHAEGKVVLLVIDEAHRLTKELLEEIRLLSNIEKAGTKLISLFFVGQKELKELLLSRQCSALRQRITLFYNIDPLTEDETREYIYHRLKVAGSDVQLFTTAAICEIQKFTKGYPRLINILCDRALLTGYIREQETIDEHIIIECSREISFLDPNVSIVQGNKFAIFSSWRRSLVARLRANNADLKKIELQEEETPEDKSDKVNSISNADGQMAGPILKKNRLWPRLIGIAGIFTLSIVAIGTYMYTNSPVQHDATKRVTEVNSDHTLGISVRKNIPTTPAPPEIDGETAPRLVPEVQNDISQKIKQDTNQAFQTAVRKSMSTAPAVPEDDGEMVSRLMSEVQKDMLQMMKHDTNEVSETKDDSTDVIPVKVQTPLSGIVHKSEFSADGGQFTHTRPTVISVAEPPDQLQPTTIELLSAAIEENNFQIAIDLLEALEKQDNHSYQALGQIHSTALTGRAKQLLTSSPVEAESLLLKAAEVNPDNIEVHVTLGKIYTRSKDYTLAIDAYENAITLNPKLPDALFNLGFIYATIGMYENAENLYARLVPLDPPYVDKALFNLAVVQEKLGKKEECLVSLKMAVAIKPENEKAQRHLKLLLEAAEEDRK